MRITLPQRRIKPLLQGNAGITKGGQRPDFFPCRATKQPYEKKSSPSWSTQCKLGLPGGVVFVYNKIITFLLNNDFK